MKTAQPTPTNSQVTPLVSADYLQPGSNSPIGSESKAANRKSTATITRAISEAAPQSRPASAHISSAPLRSAIPPRSPEMSRMEVIVPPGLTAAEYDAVLTSQRKGCIADVGCSVVAVYSLTRLLMTSCGCPPVDALLISLAITTAADTADSVVSQRRVNQMFDQNRPQIASVHLQPQASEPAIERRSPGLRGASPA